jgi:hypothetical protein
MKVYYGRRTEHGCAVDADLPPGALKGKIWISDRFDACDEELAQLFSGEGK